MCPPLPIRPCRIHHSVFPASSFTRTRWLVVVYVSRLTVVLLRCTTGNIPYIPYSTAAVPRNVGQCWMYEVPVLRKKVKSRQGQARLLNEEFTPYADAPSSGSAYGVPSSAPVIISDAQEGAGLRRERGVCRSRSGGHAKFDIGSSPETMGSPLLNNVPTSTMRKSLACDTLRAAYCGIIII